MEGYIIIHKKLLDWQHYANPDMVRVFLHLLLTADEEGRTETTYQQLSADTGLSVKVVRGCLDKLKIDGKVDRHPTNRGSIITIYDYDNYTNSQKAKRQTSVKPAETSTKPSLMEKRRDAFTESLKPFVEKYGRDMVNDFWRYWTEPNKSQTQMRFELERTWDTNRRLTTWANNQMRRKNGNNNGNTTTKEQRAAEVANRVRQLLEEDENKKQE